ncbi:MAG: hypothetical protein IPL61_40765 [Myxococcales bacterium]|nr:hypothetical protein [Myxococcales bacterium]
MNTGIRLAGLALGLVAGVAVATAQPGDPVSPEEAAPLPRPNIVAPPPVAADPGEASYREGYAALIAGDFATARAKLTTAAQLALDPELRGAARELARLADDLAGRQARLVFGGAADGADDDGEDPADGRTSFVVSTTLASLYAGVVLVDLSDTGDVRSGAALVLGATAAGFLGSFFGSRGRSISGGMAEGYSTGMLIGAINGLLLADPLGADTSERFQMAVLSGLVLGGGAGLLYGDSARPTRGQMSFVGTMATLGIASAGLGLIVTNPDVSSDTVLYTMTAGLDLGAGAGLVLGKDLTWSSGRARLVWLGALLGGVAGFGTALLIGGNDTGDELGRATAGIALAGTWGGFALAAHLTRSMRPDRRYLRPPLAAQVQVTPLAMPHGAGVGVAGAW